MEKGHEINVEVNQDQAKFLQGLGLKFLLTKNFQPKLKALWNDVLRSRISLVLLGLVSCLLISLTLLAFTFQAHSNRSEAQAKEDAEGIAGLTEGLTRLEILLEDEQMESARLEAEILGLKSDTDSLKVNHSELETLLTRHNMNVPLDHKLEKFTRLRHLLLEGAEINIRDGDFKHSILHLCAKYDSDHHVVNRLIEMGADVNIQANSYGNNKINQDLDGLTPLMQYVQSSHYKSALWFLETHPDVNPGVVTGSGYTALTIALRHRKALNDMGKSRPVLNDLIDKLAVSDVRIPFTAEGQ